MSVLLLHREGLDVSLQLPANAVGAFRRAKPDLILLDVMLPGRTAVYVLPKQLAVEFARRHLEALGAKLTDLT